MAQNNPDEVTFHSLPSDIISSYIISNLDRSDRNQIRDVNKRLRRLEKATGYRHFDYIEIYADDIRCEIKTHANYYIKEHKQPTSELAAYLNHATTETLAIKGRSDKMFERWILCVLQTLRFHTLRFAVDDNQSVRILRHLLRSHKEINEVDIRWNIEDNNSVNIKQMILQLPPMEKYVIRTFDQKRRIDDEILHNLIGISSASIEVDVQHTGITADGMETAFEMMQKVQKKNKTARFSVKNAELIHFLRQIDHSIYEDHFTQTFNRVIIHLKSGAILKYSLLSLSAQYGVIEILSKCEE